MSYLKGDCGVNRMDSESNENVYGKFGSKGRRNELWTGGGEAQHTEVVEMV